MTADDVHRITYQLTTAELVTELSRREGVERIDIEPQIPVYTDVFECATLEPKLIRHFRTEGPCVVLTISD